MTYYIAYDDGNIIIRTYENGQIERFDVAKKKWIEDFEMCQIYFGGIPVKEISEKEALEHVERSN